jgi:hypothetical protein
MKGTFALKKHYFRPAKVCCNKISLFLQKVALYRKNKIQKQHRTGAIFNSQFKYYNTEIHKCPKWIGETVLSMHEKQV